MSAIVRMRERHGHPETTARKVAEVEQIARLYQALRRETAHRHWAHEHLPVVLHKKTAMSVVTARRRSGEAARHPLGSHLQANAVVDGLDVVRGSWEQALAKTRSAASRKFSDAERHQINWLLRWPEHVVSILDGVVVAPDDQGFSSNDHERLCRWLASALRRFRPGQPSLRRSLAFEIDGYRVQVRTGRFPVWLTTQGLTAGRPLRIPMSGSDTELLDGTANLRVAVEADTRGRRRIVFRRAVEIEVIERPERGEAVGIDKGANTAITATSSDTEHAVLLAPEAGDALSRRSERSFRGQRSRLASHADNLAGRQAPGGRFHGNPNPSRAEREKARRIRKNNLGARRRDREQQRAEAEMKNLVGRAAREMVEAFPDASVFYEEKLDFRGSDARKPRHVNRKLNRWTKRELSAAIERHVSASGARREFVNAAYTSQACPRCSWTDRGNRKDIAFRCSHCGYRGHADAVASSNVLRRGRDGTVPIWMSQRGVKKSLAEQHAEWRVSAGTDARCASRGCGEGLPAVGPAGSGREAA